MILMNCSHDKERKTRAGICMDCGNGLSLEWQSVGKFSETHDMNVTCPWSWMVSMEEFAQKIKAEQMSSENN